MARIPAAERRAELVAAAVRVIAAHGVDGATTRRIAEEANAPLATLHYCFDTKEVLFAAVFEYLAGEYRNVLHHSDVHSDTQSTARGLLHGVLQWYRENPNFGATILELISWGQREGKQAEVVYTEAFETMRTILEGTTTAAGRPVDPDTIDQLIYVVAALSDGFALNWLVFTDAAAAQAQVELTLGVLDAWMAANLGDAAVPAAPPADIAPEPDMRSLVSWVRMD
ncbi:TetR/AcrR family transcriptional regulator [Nocardia donostiensis]|uniref:TetR family transcriptional regulator n=1 Tax=Nocardia donostiensis TaxID=1538463 RepID=A0A1V2TJW5_9NOCA|nr:TetR/AcrR family transcriptional regulator [Nocardia donostiensis]ONM49807.1 TetR family transcriptional regulator [Nocardia donostiensis]OQS12671.1 TetR family transcriptional regulator [Nocardia donostiensis]OQS22237.1 TetR family transcriptional regulator [Nocardia donostiensis]